MRRILTVSTFVIVLTGLFAFNAPLTESGQAIRLLNEIQTATLPEGPVDISDFSDALPIPQKIDLTKMRNAETTLHLNQFKTQFHTDFPMTDSWGYNGQSPGPMIIVRKNQKVKIHYQNDLPTKKLLAVDDETSMPGMPMPNGVILPSVRNVTHMHGAVVRESNPTDRENNNDGWPDAWNVPGQTQTAIYTNPQSARMLWYHDHAMGETAHNVYSGLYGSYIIRDHYEKRLNLPKDQFEIPIIFQAKGFNDDGTFFYPKKLVGEFYGNTITINGKIWPSLNVEPRKYRFRFLNSSSARAVAVKLVDAADQSPGPAFHQIGSDSGFLDHTVVLNDPTNPKSMRLDLAPAERADVIIDFSKYAGKNFVMDNNSLQDPGEGEILIQFLMAFRVGTTLSSPDTSEIPNQMRKIERLSPARAKETRQIVITSTDNPGGAPTMLLNGMLWDAPVADHPKLGTSEVWEIVNTLVDLHPFHVHLVQFQILDRRPFDTDEYEKSHKIVFTGDAILPDENEMGWKDVVKTQAGTVTRIIMRFNTFAGHYIYHCHILEHEDMGMMRPFEVVK